MTEQHIQVIHKISEALINALQQVHTITAQYINIINQQKKQKDLPKITKVYFDKEQLNEETKVRHIFSNNQDANRTSEPKMDQLLYPKSTDNLNAKTAPKAVTYKSREMEPEATQKSDRNGKNQQKQMRLFSKKSSHPQRPKQPVSAFLLFNLDYAGKVKKQYPHLSQTDLVTVTGNLWKQLSPEDKKPFEDQYRRAKLKYDAEMIEFYRKFPAEKSKKQLRMEKSLGSN